MATAANVSATSSGIGGELKQMNQNLVSIRSQPFR